MSVNNFPITWIPIPGEKNKEKLAISQCPGKQTINLNKQQDLINDLISISNQQITCIISLITKAELLALNLKNFENNIRLIGFKHYVEEIEDLGVPKQNQLDSFAKLIQIIICELNRDSKVLIHCNAGLGRSGLLAGIILKEMTDLLKPVEYVREFREGAVETKNQEQFIECWRT